MFNTGNKRFLAILLILLILIIAAVVMWLNLGEEPLEGIVSSNGRVEAEDVNIAARYAGRVEEIFVDEGDTVRKGQTVAKMDADVLMAELREAEAAMRSAVKQKKNALAILDQQKSECELAKRNLSRYRKLFKKGIISEESMDEASTNAEASLARCEAADAQVESAQAAIEQAEARIERLKVQIGESDLISPVDGRVQYRLAEQLEVLPSGGRVVTVLDMDDIYMNIFLPALEAGMVSIGAEARILLDAFPNNPFPARVTFVSPEAQFTPKEVETESVRQKLSFRVKLNLVNGKETVLKPGMPGEAYIRIAEDAEWPEFLK